MVIKPVGLRSREEQSRGMSCEGSCGEGNFLTPGHSVDTIRVRLFKILEAHAFSRIYLGHKGPLCNWNGA